MVNYYVPDPGPESRWTGPRSECLHPEWWTSDDQDSTEYEVSELVGAFVRALQPEYVVETGTAFGQTAEIIGRALDRNGHGQLVTLEPDPLRAKYSQDRCEGLPVRVLLTPSLEFVPEQTIDFAWLDSLLHLRAQEARQWRGHFRRGSIIGMHDTGPQHGIGPLLTELVAEGWLRHIMLPTPRGVSFAEIL